MSLAVAEETLPLVCKACRAPMRARVSAIGKRVACPKCRTAVVVERPSEVESDDVACPHCGAVTSTPKAFVGSIRCSGCMMPLPDRSPRAGARAGFLDLLPVPIAAFLMVLSGWSLTALLPALFGEMIPGFATGKLILGTAAFINSLVFLCSLGFLLRIDAGRVGLGWLLGIGAVLGLIASIATLSPIGLGFAVLYGLAAVLFFSGHGESYVAGGPPGPKIALAVTAGAVVVAALFGLGAWQRSARVAEFKRTMAEVDARIVAPTNAYIACVGTQKKLRTPLVEACLKQCDEAERSLRALGVDRRAVLKGCAQVARLRLRALALAPEPLPFDERVRASARALVAELRSATAGDSDPLGKVAATEATNLESALAVR
jgi:hypothetical protein